MNLARWACDPTRSRGRRFAEGAVAAPRNEHQRDHDRIVHCTAFRRLVYKTQVFINHEGDLYRTRMTHSLEVAQIGRSIARALRLNEDLVAAIALAHDLGHTPFGHAGQEALHDCMRGQGGFEHNLQSLRVVDALEARYPAFDGLNLSFETREGILKHCSRERALALEAAEPGGVGQRFLHGGQPSLEAQVVNLADELTYSAHDIDDGVRSGLLTLGQLEEVPMLRRYLAQVQADFPALAGQAPRRLLFECLRRMLSDQIYDVVAHTTRGIEALAPADADAVRQAGQALAGCSPELAQGLAELKRFLFANLYRHPQVVAITARGKEVIRELFAAYLADPQQLPAEFRTVVRRERSIADYVAGMTDRFAAREYRRLRGQPAFEDAAL